ncbi:MAG: flagellar hook-basal body protein [Armatimonadota bacterium]
MTRGLYAAAAAMLADLQRQDVAANNLANLDTPGFKRDVSFQRALAEMLATDASSAPLGSRLTGTTVDVRQGDFVRTDAPLDIALDGDGFFVVASPAGEFLTRNGRFTLNRDGELVTAAGLKVLGDKGPIRLSGGRFEVGEAGRLFVDGQFVDTLRIVAPADPSELVKVGDSLMAAPSTQPAGRLRVLQGFYERSNVVAIEELTGMIRGLRGFEANAKALTSQDESLQRLIRAAAGR